MDLQPPSSIPESIGTRSLIFDFAVDIMPCSMIFPFCTLFQFFVLDEKCIIKTITQIDSSWDVLFFQEKQTLVNRAVALSWSIRGLHIFHLIIKQQQ